MLPVSPGRYVVECYTRRRGGIENHSDLPVVAFADDGIPLVAGERWLERADELGVSWYLQDRQVLEPVPAGPGWYVVVAWHSPARTDLERWPVLAWRGTQTVYDGSAVILAEDGSGAWQVPVDAFAYVEWRALGHGIDAHLVGFFHPDQLPEPPGDQLVDQYRKRYLTDREREAQAR